MKKKGIWIFLGVVFTVALGVLFFLLWQTQQALDASQKNMMNVQKQIQELSDDEVATPTPYSPPQPSPVLKNRYVDDKYHFEVTFPEEWPKFQVKRGDDPSSGVIASYGFTFEGPFPAIDLYLTEKTFQEHLLQDYPLKWRDNFAVANTFDGITFYYQNDDSYFLCAQLSANDCTYRKQIDDVMTSLKKYTN